MIEPALIDRLFLFDPHLVQVQGKIAINKGWQKKPIKKRLAINLLKTPRFKTGEQTFGLVPSSVSMAVIDLDTDESPVDESYPLVEEKLGTPACTVETPSGGLHLYYLFDQKYPEHVNNAAIFIDEKRIGDVRATNGYVLLYDAEAVVKALEAEEYAEAAAWDMFIVETGQNTGADVLADGPQEGNRNNWLFYSVKRACEAFVNPDERQVRIEEHLKTVLEAGFPEKEARLVAENAQKAHEKHVETNNPVHIIHGKPIKFPTGSYEIGDWAGSVEKDNPNYVYDSETGDWYEDGEICWKLSDWSDVRTFFQHELKNPLANYYYMAARAAAHKALEDADDEKRLKRESDSYARLANRIVSGAFQERAFQDGATNILRRALTEPPDNEISTPTGILVITEEGASLRPWIKQTDNHKAAISAPFHSRITIESYQRPFIETLSRWIPNDSLRRYLQVCLGAALIGRLHRKYFLIIGAKGTGKSTFSGILRSIFGDLMRTAADDLFNPGAAHNNALANVITERTRLLDLPESQSVLIRAEHLNRLTGRDQQETRRPYGHVQISGTPIAVPLIFGEAPPTIYGMTSGTMDRQIIIKFDRPERVNRNLIFDIVDPENQIVQGAFGWVVNGAIEYMKNGLPEYDEVELSAEDEAAKREALEMQDEVLFYLSSIYTKIKDVTLDDVFNFMAEQYMQRNQVTNLPAWMTMQKIAKRIASLEHIERKRLRRKGTGKIETRYSFDPHKIPRN